MSLFSVEYMIENINYGNNPNLSRYPNTFHCEKKHIEAFGEIECII